MKNQKWLVALGASLVLVGCGDSGSSVSTETKVPSSFTNKVVNNRGLVVESQLDGNSIKIYSDSVVTANPKNIHKGVVVKVNGKSSKTMPIEISYLNKNIIAIVSDSTGKELAVSAEIEVTDVPVIVIELSI
jgi:hypothetical protein